MNITLEEKVMEIQQKNKSKLRNSLLKDYTPFIIKTIAQTTGRYVEVENDEEFSIGLIAFNEAIDKYRKSKGSFLNFARLVVRSRILDFLKGKTISIDSEQEISKLSESKSIEHQISLEENIKKFSQILKGYHITFDQISDNSPTHKKTRCRCFFIAKKVIQDESLVNHIKTKKRLPVTKIARLYNISKRMVKYSKKYILSLVLIYIYQLEELEEYIEYLGGECDEKR